MIIRRNTETRKENEGSGNGEDKALNQIGVRFEMSQKDDTGFPAYSDSAGTAKKCHCKRGASYCVTVSKKKLLYEGPIGSSQKCHCKRGASYSVASLTSISTSTDPRTMDEAHQQDFQPIASQLQLVVDLILHITTSVYLFVCSSLARSRIVRLWHARME